MDEIDYGTRLPFIWKLYGILCDIVYFLVFYVSIKSTRGRSVHYISISLIVEIQTPKQYVT